MLTPEIKAQFPTNNYPVVWDGMDLDGWVTAGKPYVLQLVEELHTEYNHIYVCLDTGHGLLFAYSAFDGWMCAKYMMHIAGEDGTPYVILDKEYYGVFKYIWS